MQPRYYHTLTRIGSELVLVGGATSTSKICDAAVFCYNPATSIWRQLTLCGEPSLLERTAHAAAPHPTVSSQLIVMGGYGTRHDQGNPACLSDTVVVDITSGDVRRLVVASSSFPRTYHSLSSVGRFIIVVGGRTFDPTDRLLTGDDVVAVLDVQQAQWITPTVAGTPPQPRSSHRAVVHGNTVLIFGGAGRTRTRLDDLVGLRVVEQARGLELTWVHPQGSTPPGARHEAMKQFS